MCANKTTPSSSEIAAANVYERFLTERGFLAEPSPGDNPPDWVFQVSGNGSTNESWAVEVTELHRNFKVDSDWVPERSIFVPVLEEQDRRGASSTVSHAPRTRFVRVKPGESHPRRVLSDIEHDDIILVSIDSTSVSGDGRPVDSNPTEFAKIATSLAIERKGPIFRKLKGFDRRVMLLISEFAFPPDPKVIMEVFYRTTADLSFFDEVCLIHQDRITVVLGRREDHDDGDLCKGVGSGVEEGGGGYLIGGVWQSHVKPRHPERLARGWNTLCPRDSATPAVSSDGGIMLLIRRTWFCYLGRASGLLRNEKHMGIPRHEVSDLLISETSKIVCALYQQPGIGTDSIPGLIDRIYQKLKECYLDAINTKSPLQQS